MKKLFSLLFICLITTSLFGCNEEEADLEINNLTFPEIEEPSFYTNKLLLSI